jgi:hypothetical protein
MTCCFSDAIVTTNTFLLWDRGFDSRFGTQDMHVKRVSQSSTESRVFSPGTPVSSHRECWQGGLGLAPNWPFHRSCAPWSDMSHKVAVRGALRKPSTRPGWAASCAIQFSSQLQVRMISTSLLTFLCSLSKIRILLWIFLNRLSCVLHSCPKSLVVMWLYYFPMFCAQ